MSLKFISWIRFGRKAICVQLKIIVKVSTLMGEISAVECSRKDEVMEEEIIKDIDMEEDDEKGDSWSLTAIIESAIEIEVKLFVESEG